MGDGEQASFKKSVAAKGSGTPDFMRLEIIQKVQEQNALDRSDQAAYIRKNGIPNALDILRSAKFSRPEVPASLKKETAQGILRSVDLPQSLPDRLGLYPKDQWTGVFGRIDKALTPARTPETLVQNYDKHLHRIYPSDLSSRLRQAFALKGIVTLKETRAINDALTCLSDEEWQALRRQGLTDRVEITSGPLLQTDQFGYALCCGEEKVKDQQQIKTLLDEKYMRVSDTPVLPGDRMMIYSRSQQAYVAAGMVEECNWDTWEPTDVSYLVRDSGSIHQSHPQDFYRKATSNIEVQYYRRKNLQDDLIVLGSNVKDIKDAKLIVWGDNHSDYAGSVLCMRMMQEHLNDGDTVILEMPEREDRTVDMGDKRIVEGTWDNEELREKFRDTIRKQVSIAEKMGSSRITAADQLAKLGQESYNGEHWASLPQVMKTMQEILGKYTEESSALEKELQGQRETFDTYSLGRSKSLGTAIERRMTQSPDKRLFVNVGRAHILIEQERKEYNLDKYPHVVFISRYPVRIGRSSREYSQETLAQKSETTDTVES